MKTIAASISRIALRLSAGVAAFIGVFTAHPVLGAALELFPSEFNQKIALVSTDPRVIAARVINAVLLIIGVVLVALILYGGYTWMTAAGEEEKVTRAKKTLTAAVIGLVIILSSMAITRFVLGTILGDVSTGDACTTAGVTQSCNVGFCAGTRTCSSNGFYGSCLKIDPACNSGSEGLPRGSFGVVAISPSGAINSKKIVVKVMLSDIPKADTVPGSIVVKNKATGATVPGTVYQGAITFARGTANEKVLPLSADTIAFVPQALCAGFEARDLHCFDASTEYTVEVLPSLSRGTDNASVYCGLGGDKCRGSFTSGAQVDVTPPTVSLRVDPSGSLTTTECATVQADVRDDGGIGEVEFWHTATNARNAVSIDKFAVEGGNGSSSRVFSARWCPGATTSVDERHAIYVRAFDNDTGMTESTRVALTLRPGSCTVCGPGCGACAGGSCQANTDCFDSLTCDATSRTCQSKPRITLVSPSNGRPGTMVTVWGMYFGTTSGRVEFTAANGARVAAEVPNRCGATFRPWEVDARTGLGTVTVVVPQGAVDGPLYVTNTAGVTDASNDTNGVLTPSSLPGPGVPPAGEFDVNDINRPGLCSINPGSGIYDTRVAIAGLELGSSGAVIIGSTPAARIDNYTNTSVSANVPHTTYGANQPVTVVASNGNESNAVRFTVNSPDAGTVPEITSIDPSASGGPSSGITIRGKNFGAAPGVVYFAAPDGQVVKADLSELPESCGGNYWKETEIRVKVPRVIDKDDWNANGNRSEVLEDRNYKVYVVRYDNAESNRPAFAMQGRATARPFIWCITPQSGKSFTNITVYGDELGGVPAANRGLMFNVLATGSTTPSRVVATLTNVGGVPGAPCPTSGWDDHMICAQVPGNAVSGKVRVETTCGDIDCISNDVDFNIGSCSDPKTPLACRASEQCCSDGVCRANGMCQASVPNGFYGWTFTTAATPVSPRVVEDCAENALSAGVDTSTLAGRYASPAPWAARSGGDAACVNAAVTVRFTPGVLQESLTTNRVVVEQCGAGTASPAVRLGFEQGANETLPQIIKTDSLGVSLASVPGTAAEGTGALILTKLKPAPDRNASRCSSDVTLGCTAATQCAASGATCDAGKGNANVFTDEFAARVTLPSSAEVRGRTYVAAAKVRAPQGSGTDESRRVGILVRKTNTDGTREEVRTISEPLTDRWQEISARLTMSEKAGAAEVRIFLVSPDVSVRNADTNFYLYSALVDAVTVSDIAGVDCKERVAVRLQSIPANRGVCDGDYKTACSNDAECDATVGGACVKATDGFMLMPDNATSAFTGAVCDKGDAAKIGKACTNDASCGTGGLCRDGVWYRVSLKSGVCKNNTAKACVVNADCGTGARAVCEGITAFDPSGAAMKENPGACGSGNAYCFLFRVVQKTCAVGAVITTPNPWTAKTEGEPISYTAVPVAASDACINLNPSGFSWQWSSSNTSQAGVDLNPSAGKVGARCRVSSECAIGDCVNGYCTAMPWTATATALNETPVLPKPQPVKITATVESADRSKINGPSDLYIQFAEPAVTDVWPRCAAACLNAEVGAHFNIPMDRDSLMAAGNVQLWRVNCGNARVDGGEDCDDGNTVAGDGCSNICTSEGSNFIFNCGNGILNTGEECDDRNAVSGDSCSAVCLREAVLTGAWTFEKNATSVKLIGQKDPETGWTSFATGVCGDGTVQQTPVSGGSVGESCDDGNTASGDGCSATCSNEGTTAVGAVCGNAKLERGEECEKGTDGRFASWCDATKCVRAGTSAPVCGNNKLDPGEACEKSQLTGAAQALCDTRCLWTGTASYSPPVRLVGCGNGKTEVGESCDDGNAKSGDGCSAICLNEGSTTNAGPGCGNGRVDKGEACDSADALTKDGCNPNTCLHTGTKTAKCGNGVLETGETCDWRTIINGQPPGTNPGQAESQATAACDRTKCVNLGTTAPICGNGRVDTGESCDDGNVLLGDGCSAKCLNEGTVAATVPISVRISNESNNEVIIEPQDHALLSPNSTYRAILMGEAFCVGQNCTPGIQSASRKALTGLNFWRSNTADSRNSAPPGVLDARQTPNSYSWTFATGTELCTPERIDVVPAESSLYMIGARTRLDVKAKSKPDSCNADGQVLNAMLYGWTWKSDKTDVASVVAPQDRVPACGDGMVERGEDCDDSNAIGGDGCSAVCVNEGSGYSRQCGNGRIDAGESCDDGNIINGDFCSSKCLVEGFIPGSWRLSNVSGVCGNGVREHIANATAGNPGEECDDGNLAKNDGCSPLCIKEGSRAPLCNTDNNRRVDADAATGAGEACDPKAGSALGCDPNRCVWMGTSFASCGNKTIERGEDCDDGNIRAGDGCSAVCLREGVTADWAVTRSEQGEIRMIANAAVQAGFRIVSRGVCGNGVRETFALGGLGGTIGEECDDGNANPNDGCSARCANEGTARITTIDNPGGDPMQWVEAKGIAVQKFCRQADQDFPESNRTSCNTNQDCAAQNRDGQLGYVCDAYNPWATATIEAKINATPARQERANGKAGTGAVTVYCGAKSDAECTVNTTAGTDAVGVGTDSCCYERPTPNVNLVEPTISQGVCPNGVFAIGFNQVIDESSLGGNVLLAKRVDGTTCPAGSVPVDALGHLQSSVKNSSFEATAPGGGILDWTTVSDGVTGTIVQTRTPNANSGSSSMGMDLQNVTRPGSALIASTPISIDSGTRYRATVWYNVVRFGRDHENAAMIRVRGENGFRAQYAIPKDAPSGSWRPLYVSFVPNGQGKYFLELVAEKPILLAWDDVSLEAMGSTQSAASWIRRTISWIRDVVGATIVQADTGLWCVGLGVDATVEPQTDGVSSLVRVMPKQVLDTTSQYKLIARGDSSLADGSVDGITNYRGVAMNGEIAHQWMFTTAEKLCTLDAVRIDLSCVRNGKCQNNTQKSCTTDRDCGPATDTTARCQGQALSGAACAAFRKKDQATTVRAAAISNAAGGQEIQPIDGYRWAWNFNTSAVDVVSISKNTAMTRTTPAAPIQRRGGAAGGQTCPPETTASVTCQDGRCGGSSYLRECRTNADCASLNLATCSSAIAVSQQANAGTKRGEAFVSAAAKITEDKLNAGLTSNLGQTTTGTERFVSTLCENPWPSDTARRCSANPNRVCSTDVDCAGFNDGVCVAALPLSDPSETETGGPLGGSRPTNFSLWYCRDATPTLPEPQTIGLPELTTLSAAPSQSTMARALFRDGSGDVSIAATTSRSEILKEVILTYATSIGASTDAIGVRVLKNDDRLSPLEWYQSQGFTGKPVTFTDTVDGYQAIQDGRTVYIGGTNVTEFGSEPRVYSNMYVIAYNEGASEATKTVYREILKNFRLNINLGNARVCSLDVAKSCTQDTECAPAAGTCMSDIDKLHRDIIRAGDLSRMSIALQGVQSRTGAYPQLASGSYVRAMTTSRWPSWQGALGSTLGIVLPDDPLKSGFGKCNTEPNFDPATCFNQVKGEYQCPPGSQIYQYQSIGSQAYKLSANFEYKPAGLSQPYPSMWGLDSRVYDIAHCRAQNGTSIYSNRLACGDGVVGRDASRTCTTDAQCPTGSRCDQAAGICAEECEPGQIDRRSCSMGIAPDARGVCVNDATMSCYGAQDDCPGYSGTADPCVPRNELDPQVCRDNAREPCTSDAQCDGLGACVSLQTPKFCQRNTAIDCTNSVAACTQGGIDYGPCIAVPGNTVGEQFRMCNAGGNNACRYAGWSSCRVSGFCGDNKVDAGEVCDDGNLNGTYGKCNATCSAIGNYCGDGRVDAGEVCDDGNLNGTYGKCKDDCSGNGERCGDSVVQKSAGETCDPVGAVVQSAGVCSSFSSATHMQNQACSNDAQCGGKCAFPSGRACRGTCFGDIPCINGVCVKLVGSCTTSSDCSEGGSCYIQPNVCQKCAVQNGYQGVRKATCSASCRVTEAWGNCTAQGQCGNGLKEGSEQCDDGNTNNNDGCIIDSASGKMCVLSRCGDGFVTGKVCAGDTPGQERTCSVDNDCGQGGRCIVKEECDQGADNGQVCSPRSGSECTYCSNACKRITVSGDYCGDGKWNSAVEECDKDLNPAVNAWQGLILKNASAQETGRYLCIGTPGVTQNAWNFADSSQWRAVEATRFTVSNAIEQEGSGNLVNTVLEVKPVTSNNEPITNARVLGIEVPAVSGGATNRTFQVSLIARCGTHPDGRNVDGACGQIGVQFARENVSDQSNFDCASAPCITVIGSQWKTLNQTLTITPGIQNHRLRVYVIQGSTRFPVWIDRVSVVPLSVSPAPSPWNTATVAGNPAVGSGKSNVAMCNAQTCGRGCPLGGTVCENMVGQRVCVRSHINDATSPPTIICDEYAPPANDGDADGVADSCDNDKDGDSVLDVNDCNADDKDLNSDVGMLMSYSGRSWEFMVDEDVKTLHFFVANYNVNADPGTERTIGNVRSKHDLRMMGDAEWVRQENERMKKELAGKQVCVNSSNQYSSQICIDAIQCKHAGDTCKPWDQNPNRTSFGMRTHEGFFQLKFSLNGSTLRDERGQDTPTAPAAPLGSPEEIVIPIPPGTGSRRMKMEWLNDWCDRGVQYGCTAAGDGIGHDLNLVIQRILIDTETSAGRCERLATPQGNQFWPSGTYTPPPAGNTSALPTGQSCTPTTRRDDAPAYSASCSPYMQGATQIGYVPCSPGGRCVSCATDPMICQQKVCSDGSRLCASNTDCPVNVPCVIQGQSAGRQYTCDTASGACVRI